MQTSGGAHDHIRSYVMNETKNVSYYANEELIKVAQRRFRAREIKKFLLQFKKDEQNATIIELKKDLYDLDIDPDSLFELGHELKELQGDE